MNDKDNIKSNSDGFEESLESSRRKKVENFKVNFGDDFFGNTIEDDTHSLDGGRTSHPNETQKNNSEPDELYSDSADSFFNSQVNSFEDEEITSYSTQGAQHQYTKQELKQQEKAMKAALKSEKKRNKAKAKKNNLLFKMIWIAMVVIVGIVLGQFLMIGTNDLLAFDRNDASVVSVKIPKDASLDTIADILKDKGVIKQPFFFKLYATVTKASDSFNQGVFEIEKNKDYEAIINFLQSNANRKDIVTISFSEGMSVELIAQKLSDEGVCDKKQFLDLCRSDVFDEDYDFLAEIDDSTRYYKLEGYLFPDTYDFYVGEDAEDTIQRFLANFKNKCITQKTRISGYDKKVNIRRQAELQGYTLDEIINLASLIQKEAANTEDMYLVSSVFRNRLDTAENDGYSSFNEYNLYLLQSEAVDHYMKELPSNYRSFFDTQSKGGLPGGSICNPGMAAINAALNPDSTDYYYFCHKSATQDEQAEAYYARTLSEHNQNLTYLED